MLRVSAMKKEVDFKKFNPFFWWYFQNEPPQNALIFLAYFWSDSNFVPIQCTIFFFIFSFYRKLFDHTRERSKKIWFIIFSQLLLRESTTWKLPIFSNIELVNKNYWFVRTLHKIYRCYTVVSHIVYKNAGSRGWIQSALLQTMKLPPIFKQDQAANLQ